MEDFYYVFEKVKDRIQKNENSKKEKSSSSIPENISSAPKVNNMLTDSENSSINATNIDNLHSRNDTQFKSKAEVSCAVSKNVVDHSPSKVVSDDLSPSKIIDNCSKKFHVKVKGSGNVPAEKLPTKEKSHKISQSNNSQIMQNMDIDSLKNILQSVVVPGNKNNNDAHPEEVCKDTPSNVLTSSTIETSTIHISTEGSKDEINKKTDSSLEAVDLYGDLSLEEPSNKEETVMSSTPAPGGSVAGAARIQGSTSAPDGSVPGAVRTQGSTPAPGGSVTGVVRTQGFTSIDSHSKEESSLQPVSDMHLLDEMVIDRYNSEVGLQHDIFV